MPTSQIFYSWQSDLPSQANKTFIQAVLEAAIQSIRLDKEVNVEPVIDRDTLGEPGSPEITRSIFKKIDNATVFLADVSIVSRSPGSRPTPNPNVLIELGYALKALSSERIIMVFNLHSGAILDLPFDLRSRRILTYHLPDEGEPTPTQENLKSSLCDALIEIFKAGSAEEFRRNSKHATELLGKLVGILVLGEESPRLEINPWLDNLAREFKDSARWLRNTNVSHFANELELSPDIEKLSNLLSSSARHHEFGEDEEYLQATQEAVDCARALRDKMLQHGPLDDSSGESIRLLLRELVARLHAWMSRMENAREEDYDLFIELLGNLVDIGFQIEQISYYPLKWPEPGFHLKLRKLGQDLHLVRHDYELGKYGDEESLLTRAREWHSELKSLEQVADLH